MFDGVTAETISNFDRKRAGVWKILALIPLGVAVSMTGIFFPIHEAFHALVAVLQGTEINHISWNRIYTDGGTTPLFLLSGYCGELIFWLTAFAILHHKDRLPGIQAVIIGLLIMVYIDAMKRSDGIVLADFYTPPLYNIGMVQIWKLSVWLPIAYCIHRVIERQQNKEDIYRRFDRFYENADPAKVVLFEQRMRKRYYFIRSNKVLHAHVRNMIRAKS